MLYARVCPYKKTSLTVPISYTQNGILHMLDRNRRIKSCPERFQETDEQFDVIFTVEERIYDAVLEGSTFKKKWAELFVVYMLGMWFMGLIGSFLYVGQ